MSKIHTKHGGNTRRHTCSRRSHGGGVHDEVRAVDCDLVICLVRQQVVEPERLHVRGAQRRAEAERTVCTRGRGLDGDVKHKGAELGARRLNLGTALPGEQRAVLDVERACGARGEQESGRHADVGVVAAAFEGDVG